jgi:CRISPR/Cas system-associated protein Cas7 (RAMP superfamily)
MESKNCYVCGKEINTKNELGINKKLNGRNTQYFYCYDCLTNELEITKEELFAKIEEFKNQGCTLFELSR